MLITKINNKFNISKPNKIIQRINNKWIVSWNRFCPQFCRTRNSGGSLQLTIRLKKLSGGWSKGWSWMEHAINSSRDGSIVPEGRAVQVTCSGRYTTGCRCSFLFDANCPQCRIYIALILALCSVMSCVTTTHWHVCVHIVRLCHWSFALTIPANQSKREDNAKFEVRITQTASFLSFVVYFTKIKSKNERKDI